MSEKIDPPVSAAAPALIPPALEEWQARIGKRTLIRHFKREDDIFECIPIDTAAPNLVRMLLFGGHKEWRDGSKYAIAADLKGSVIDELQIAHDQEKQKLLADIESLKARGKDAESAASGLQKQIDDLTAKLNDALADNVTKSQSMEPLLVKVVAANNRSNEANSNFESERALHDATKRDLANVTTERDNARGGLDLEKQAHRDSIRALTDRAVAAENDPDFVAMRRVRELATDGRTVEISHPADAPNLDSSVVVTVWDGDTPTALTGRSVIAALAKRAVKTA